MKQLALALHNYHDTNNALPPLAARAKRTDGRRGCVGAKITSIHSRLLPFVEQSAVYAMNPVQEWLYSSCQDDPMAINAHSSGVAATFIASFRCPSDYAAPFNETCCVQGGVTPTATNNYMFSTGTGKDNFYDILVKGDGIFHIDSTATFATITDGTSNTVVLSEAVIGDGTFGGGTGGTTSDAPQAEQPWLRAGFGGYPDADLSSPPGYSALTNQEFDTDVASLAASATTWRGWRGTNWLSGRVYATTFNGYSTPNPWYPDWGIFGTIGYYAARSFHTGGVNTALGDGSVRFVSETIFIDIWRNANSVNDNQTVTLQ